MNFSDKNSYNKYENLLIECENAIEREFTDLNEHVKGEWSKHGLDGDFCHKDRKSTDGCGGYLIPFRGFNSVALQDKCLPYDCDKSLHDMIEVNHMMMSDPIIQGAVSKLVNHVIGCRGHQYTVVRRPGRKQTGNSDTRIENITMGMSLGMERIKAGRVTGWARIQRESFRRRLRGEYFRRPEIEGKHVEIRFTEPINIQHPGRWDDVSNPPVKVDDINPDTNHRIGDERPSGEFGVHYDRDDVYDVRGYFEFTGPNGDEPNYFFHKSDDMQHAKMLGDSNDERGVGLFYYSYVYIRMAGKIMDSLFRISQIQAKYAAIWTFAETARVGKIRAIADQVAKDNSGDNEGPVETAPGEHMGKGWELDLPGTKIRTREWTAMISQLLHFAGASADMPDFMMSNSAEGGRSNLVAAEGPFDLTCQTHADDQNEHDIPLLWMTIQAALGWRGRELEKMQEEFIIEYKVQSVATRDFHRFAAAVIALVRARIMSPQEATDRTGANRQMVEDWVASLPEEANIDPELVLQTNSNEGSGAGAGSGGAAAGGS